MFRMEPAELQATLAQIEQAGRDHSAWRDGLVRSIVCRLPHDEAQPARDAHRHCGLGRWYYQQAVDEVRERPAFVAIEEPHRQLHELGASLLAQAARGEPVATADYDALVSSLRRVRESLDALHQEVVAALGRRDPLTGAHGRVELLPELEEWRELARRSIEPCCLVFMDVDHLKEINDRHGHAVGDRVLAGVVQFALHHLRPYDKVFRYGGDEFVITLPGTHVAEALRLVERIRDGLARLPFVTTATGQEIHATVSLGVAPLDADARVEQSIDRADKALLHAKSAGRNRVVGWEPAINTGAPLTWEED